MATDVTEAFAQFANGQAVANAIAAGAEIELSWETFSVYDGDYNGDVDVLVPNVSIKPRAQPRPAMDVAAEGVGDLVDKVTRLGDLIGRLNGATADQAATILKARETFADTANIRDRITNIEGAVTALVKRPATPHRRAWPRLLLAFVLAGGGFLFGIDQALKHPDYYKNAGEQITRGR